jgi:tRNA (guanine-N7-)-methyltransferase
VHLKTDNRELFEYTLAVTETNGLKTVTAVTDLYREKPGDPLLSIRTHYEEMFLKEGSPITYLSFILPHDREIISPT